MRMDDKGRGYNRTRGKGFAPAMVLRLTSDGNHMCVWIQLQHTFTSDGNHTCEDESSNGPDVRE